MTSGIYDGFEGYRSATQAIREEAVRSWLVVLDTNVLLNLYNFQGQSLAEFTDVFRALGDRLFIPHQVLDEFWRNRLRTLKENQGKNLEREQIEKSFDEVESLFGRWHRRVVDRLAAPDAEAMRELQEAREALLDHIDQRQATTETTDPDTPTDQDHVLRRLEPILAGRIGSAPTSEEKAALVAAGRQRVVSKTPPGYMDAEKSPERAVGDFIVWHQTMEQAKKVQLPVLLVTNDQKEDWWADRGTAAMRARPELVEELLAISGQHLLMMRSRDLVELGHVLGVEVSSATLNEAAMASGDEVGWTAELAEDYLDYLEGWPEHYQVFVEAVGNGGSISRRRMAVLLGKNADESMKGAGKPFATAMRRVAEYHEMEYELTVPLSAGYQEGGWMTEFVVPAELQQLFALVVSSHESEADLEDAVDISE